MDFAKLIRGGSCSCGRVHTCAIRDIVVSDGALLELPRITAGYARILLVSDENTYRAAGESVFSLVGERVIGKTTFPGKPHLVPNEDAVARVEADLANADLILGVGSGVIQDLCKYVSQDTGVPYMIVATAPSMDGYAATGAAMVMGGMQVTYPTGLPLAIIADTRVMADAPDEMIRAGYGDIVGKFSALADWKLSHIVNGEYFCQEVYDATLNIVWQTVNAAEAIRRHDKAALSTLCEGLVTVGILMSYVGNSRPASGSEHHLSHFFKITGLLFGRDYLPHGIDVAYATYMTTRLRKILLDADLKEGKQTDAETYRAELTRVFGSLRDDCIALQNKANNYRTAERLPIYREKRDAIRAVLSEMPSPDEILAILERGGLSLPDFYAFYGEGHIRDAIRYAKDLKDRYTVLWVAHDLGCYGDL